MKRITFGLALFVGFLPLNSYRSVSAQGRLEVATFLRAPFVGYHVDEFSFVSAKPIASMTAQIAITPMNQVPAGGMMTVFPTALSAVDAERDSHFLFAISSATILEQHEDSTQIRTSVEFHANHSHILQARPSGRP